MTATLAAAPTADTRQAPPQLLRHAIEMLRGLSAGYQAVQDKRLRLARSGECEVALSMLFCDLQEHRTDFDAFLVALRETAGVMDLLDDDMVKAMEEHIAHETERWVAGRGKA